MSSVFLLILLLLWATKLLVGDSTRPLLCQLTNTDSTQDETITRAPLSESTELLAQLLKLVFVSVHPLLFYNRFRNLL